MHRGVLRTCRTVLKPRPTSTRLTYDACRAMATGRNAGKPPVRLVLFDVFDTLCTPRIPVHEQYYEEAIAAGIPSSSMSPGSIRKGFKPAFKEMNAKYPLYGKLSTPPISPGEWWTTLINQCLLHAGAALSDVEGAMPSLGPRLLHRFESDLGYRLFEDTMPCRAFLLWMALWKIVNGADEIVQKLREMGVKTSIVSNADPRILHTLTALGILPLLRYPPTLSWDIEASKPNKKIYQAACASCEETMVEGVIMVGDELEADYRGALGAGIEGRLIRRRGEWSDGAVRTPNEDLQGVSVISSFDGLVTEVRERNGLHP